MELADILAVIVALQDVLKGTPMQAPSNGVVPTNSGVLAHGGLEAITGTRTTN